MKTEDHVCVCNRVSLGKLQSFIERTNPTVVSQLSECLDAGTSCGWCVPFLKKLHAQHCEGQPIELSVDRERYVVRRAAYKQRNCTHDENDG